MEKSGSPTLIYIHDPMCSWCYAFNHSFAALQMHLPTNMRIEKIVGGLAADSQQAMPLTTQEYIQQTWREIEQQVSGIQFNFDFWRNNVPIRSTYPACRAVLAAAQQTLADQMTLQIQLAYYQQALNPALDQVLFKCAENLRSNMMDMAAFEQAYHSPEIETQLQQQLQRRDELNVHSYPSLCLQYGDSNEDVSAIPIDYLNWQPMLAHIQARL